MEFQPTTEELRAAYNRAWALRRRGISFDQALKDPLICKGLVAQARSHRRLEEATGHQQPPQQITLCMGVLA